MPALSDMLLAVAEFAIGAHGVRDLRLGVVRAYRMGVVMSRHVHIDEEYLSWLDNARMVRLERASAKHLKHLDGRRFDACPRG